jgi:transcriptional regulator with XRE-family HTH domain
MNESVNESMGAIIARKRKELNMTQEQLAGALGISYQAVSKWENELSSPDISTLPLLADLFDITIDELFGRVPAAAEPEKGREDGDQRIYADGDPGFHPISAGDL